MEKRGMSPLIITILVIVLSLASVGIIYAALRPLLSNTREQTTTSNACLTLNVAARQCVYNTTAAFVTLERKAGSGSFTGLSFVFDTPDGQKLRRLASTLDQLETQTFEFTGPDVGRAYRVDIAPFLASGKTCPVTGSPLTCTSGNVNINAAACSDGIDNDGDGWCDLVGATCAGGARGGDPGCTDPTNTTEVNAGLTECSNGVDDADTEDSFADGYDPDCTDPSDTSEAFQLLYECADGQDNDGDSWADSLDPDCTQNGDKENWFALAECSDGIDNDGDGRIDQADTQCDRSQGYGSFAALDNSERDKPGNPPCSDGVDNDGDGLIDMGIDPGCSNDNDAREDDEPPINHLTFYVDPVSTQLVQVNWTNEAGRTQRVIWWTNNPNSEYLLHSSQSHAGEEYWFQYRDAGEDYTSLAPQDLQYTFVSQDTRGFKLNVKPRNGLPQVFRVDDTITFHDNTMYWAAKVTNTDSQKQLIRVPFFLSGLPMGNTSKMTTTTNGADSFVTYFEPSTGGAVTANFSSNGAGSLHYPTQIGVVSPLMALWDYNYTVGMQHLSSFYGTTTAAFLPQIYTGGNQYPALWSYVETELQPGESRVFTLAYTFADSGDWQSAFRPYKDWFTYTYGGPNPRYCPTGAFAYTVGYNSNYYDRPTKRYKPGTNLTNIFAGDVAFMAQHGVSNAGLWATAIHTKHIANPSDPDPAKRCQDDSCEFSPNIDLFDPSISAGNNVAKIREYAASLTQAGVTPFFFARPCSTVWGANITYGSNGAYTINRGTYSGYSNLDLRDVAVRDAYFARLKHLTDNGIQGFYFDATDCPGSEAFMNYARTHLAPNMTFMIMEGYRDRSSLWWPQIPFPKPGNNGGVFDPKFDRLIQYLTPRSTYYGGDINNVLNGAAGEQDTFLQNGGQIVLASWQMDAAHFNSNMNRWIQTSTSNRQTLMSQYGNNVCN